MAKKATTTKAKKATTKAIAKVKSKTKVSGAKASREKVAQTIEGLAGELKQAVMLFEEHPTLPFNCESMGVGAHVLAALKRELIIQQYPHGYLLTPFGKQLKSALAKSADKSTAGSDN